jgi:trigger factor
VVEGQLGRDYILATTLEALVNDTYPRAVDAEALRIVGPADFQNPGELEEGKPYSYTVTLTLRPELTLKSSKVKIKMPPREATEKEIDAQIEGARNQFATFKPAAKTSKIKKDSTTTISFTSTLDGEEYEGSTVENYRYTLGQNLMPEAFEKALIGHVTGDEVDLEFKVEDLGTNQEFAGKTMNFKVTVDSVDKKELPELDDAFATSVGFDTLEGMREEVKSYITSQKEQSYDRVRNDRLVAALAEELKGEPTEELIESRTESLTYEFTRMLERQKTTLDDYLVQANVTPEQFKDDMKAQAKISVTQDLALEALVREKNLEISEEEFDEELVELGKALETTPEKARERWERQGLLTTLRDDIARRKAIEFLVENAEIDIDEDDFIE